MKTLPLTSAFALVALALAPCVGVARAGDEPPAPAPVAPPDAPLPPATPPTATPPIQAPAAPDVAPPTAPVDPSLCRRAVVPPTRAWTTRQVTVPPQTIVRRVPTLETVTVPVMETRQVPDYRDIQVPTYDWQEVPLYEDRSVPVYGTVEVPVYESRSVPVTLSLPNPFGCNDLCIELWNHCEQVPVGTEQRPGIVRYETERVQTGTEKRQVQTGTETRTVCVGYHPEQQQVGERQEQRCTGYHEETVVVAPARVDQVRECVCRPERTVTVVPDDAPKTTPPLAGTTEVLTESEYRSALTAARTR